MVDEFVDWLRSLDADALTDYRFELYDVTELAEPDSELYEFASAALDAIGAIEAQRRARRDLRDMCSAAAPDVDADAFAGALPALLRAQRQLGAVDVVEAFRGAFEVAENRARVNGGVG